MFPLQPCHRTPQGDSREDKESETAREEAKTCSNVAAGKAEKQDQRTGTAEDHRNHESKTEAKDGTIAMQPTLSVAMVHFTS